MKSTTPCYGNNILISLFSLDCFFTRTGGPNHSNYRLTQWKQCIDKIVTVQFIK